MRLLYEPCNMDIDITSPEKSVCSLSIEKPELMCEFLKNLWNAINGKDNYIYFTEKDKRINLEKQAVFISNPFEVNINEKKILTHLYHDMVEISFDEGEKTTASVNSEIVCWLDQLSKKLPYPINYALDIDPIGLFKLYSVSIDDEAESLVEYLTNYIKLSHSILGITLFIFYHISDYLSEESLIGFIEMVQYEQVSVMFIENNVKYKLKCVKYIIIDADNCVIEY